MSTRLARSALRGSAPWWRRVSETGQQARSGVGQRSQLQRLVGEPRQDDGQQTDDHRLEPLAPQRGQRQDHERDHGGEARRRQQRDAEQQVQRHRRADELGQVGGHRDQLRLQPQQRGHRPGEVRAAQLRQVLPGGDAELGRQVLDEHGQQAGQHDDPQQPVAVGRPARHVGREVAGIDVGDRDDEGGSHDDGGRSDASWHRDAGHQEFLLR
jgi:hypothetical protein